jgi:hypothetical protein
LWIIGHCILGINLPHGPIIVISQSKSIMFLYWPFLENIVSCAYCIWYGDLIAEWDGPIIVISQSKEIVFLHSPLPGRISYLVPMPRTNFILNWFT